MNIKLILLKMKKLILLSFILLLTLIGSISANWVVIITVILAVIEGYLLRYLQDLLNERRSK